MSVEHDTKVLQTSPRSSRTLRRVVTIGASFMVLIGLALLFLLTQATNNRELYERNYAWLFVVNMAVAGLLFCAVFWVGYRLYIRLREGRFGSRLLLKLATIFALVGLAPGMLIYVVSYQFVSRSIETWFDVKVETALEAGLSLGRVTLDSISTDFVTKSRAVTEQFGENADSSRPLMLERIQEQIGATDVAIWTSAGGLVASVGETRFQLSPDKPTPSQFRAARSDRSAGLSLR